MSELRYIIPKKGLIGKIGQYLAYGEFTNKQGIFKDKSMPSDQQIINSIMQQFKDLSAREMRDWRNAVMIADNPFNPRWAPLQDLYDQLEPDAQLGTSKDIRLAATLGRTFVIYDKRTNEELPEKTDLLKDKEWFFNFCWEFLDAIFYGYTVAQLVNPSTMEFSFIPRRNYIPQKNFVCKEIYGNDGFDLSDPSFANSVLSVRYKHKFGILNDIVPNLIWKKNARQAWAEFAEKFGIPPIWATTTKSDKGTLDRIEQMLKQLGEAATAVLPQGTTVTAMEVNGKGDPFKVYAEQVALDDAAIAKRLLGGTMVIDDGSSRSQSEVHERTLKEVIGLFDKMLITFLVNSKLMPLMAKYGYPFTENDAFKFDDTEQIGLKDLADVLNKLLTHFEVDDKMAEWVSKKYGMPLSKKTIIAPTSNFNQAPLALAAALGAKGVLLPNYSSSCGHRHHKPVAETSQKSILSNIADELINDVFNGKETLLNEILASIKESDHFRNGLFDGWGERRMKLTYDATDNHCLAMMEYNLFEFSRLKEKANVIALNLLLIDPETKAPRPFRDFQQKANEYLTIANGNHLRTEYNMSVAVGQNASRYHQFMSDKDKGVSNFVQWQTVGDSHVRETHVAMNGRIFDLNENLTIWPPKEWGCRCEMVQYIGKPPEGKICTNSDGLKDLKIEKGSQWDVNRGEIEQVFTANEMYYKNSGLAEEFNKEIQKIGWQEYKLTDVKDMAGLPNLKIDTTITEQNVSELFKKVKGQSYMGFTDYLDRKMVLKETNFTKHTSGEYATLAKGNRHEIFPFVEDVLKNPDEVYFTEYTGRPKEDKSRYQTNYVKFYTNEKGENKILSVNTICGSENVEINTWQKYNSQNAIRRGYLIYQKKKP